MTTGNSDPEFLPVLLVGLYVYLVAVAPIVLVALPLFITVMFLFKLKR